MRSSAFQSDPELEAAQARLVQISLAAVNSFGLEGADAIHAERGWVRILIEWSLFGFAVWSLAAAPPPWALAFGLVLVVNYALMVDRLVSLIAR